MDIVDAKGQGVCSGLGADMPRLYVPGDFSSSVQAGIESYMHPMQLPAGLMRSTINDKMMGNLALESRESSHVYAQNQQQINRSASVSYRLADPIQMMMDTLSTI